MITIISTYTQQVSTIHPDLIIEVPFKYKAVVNHDGYEVDVIEVHNMDGANAMPLSVDKSVYSTDRFLAYIREDARTKAYQITKVSSHEQAFNRGH